MPAELLSSRSFSTLRTSSTVRAIGWLTAGVVGASTVWLAVASSMMVMTGAFCLRVTPFLDFLVLLGSLGMLPVALSESEFRRFREDIYLSCSLNFLSTRMSLECIIALLLTDSCCNSSILAWRSRSDLLTNLGSVTIGHFVPLFTEAFVDPEVLLVRCRMFMSDSEGTR